MLKGSLRDILGPKTKSWRRAEPESYSQSAPLNVFLHHCNPLMVLSIFFSHGCLAFTGFHCRRKTSGKSNPSLFLCPKDTPAPRALKTLAFLSHTENLCGWKEAEAEREPPAGGGQDVQTAQRLAGQRRSHFLPLPDQGPRGPLLEV